MAYLSFVSDEKLKALVSEILNQGRVATETATRGFNRNTIDPFAILWEMASFSNSFEDWYKNEISRQAQKTLTNQIGMFHQKLLGLAPDWEDLGVGNLIDLVNHKKKIIAEIKNKHNTVTGGNLGDVYTALESLVMPKGQIYKGYTAYFVEIIPKSPIRYNIPFTPSDKKTSTKCAVNEQIRKIDGASFYSLVTESDDALLQVFNVLPKVIKDVSPESSISVEEYDGAKKYFEFAYVETQNKRSKTSKSSM